MQRVIGSLEKTLALLNAIADGVSAQDPQGKLIFVNEAAARLSGYPSPEAMLAAPLIELAARFDIFDEADDRLDFSQLPGRIALTGEPAPERILRYHNRETGEERWSAVKAQPSFTASGELEFVVNIFRDVTVQKQQEIRQQFLIEAGKTLAESIDYERTLATVARLATPKIADWCAIDLVDEDGQIQRVAVAHIDPDMVQWAYELQRKYPPQLDGNTGFAKVIKTGQTDYYPRITDEHLVAAAGQDAELLLILRKLAIRSSAIIPLTARGHTLGAITLVTTADSGRHLSAEDVLLAEELGRTAALAVDNAKLYSETLSERERLKRSNEDLEVFAYVASHDLQEPLRMIASYLQILEERYTHLFDPDAKEFIGFAVDGAKRMKTLISDILQYSRVTSKSKQRPFVAFSSQDALRTALQDLQIKITESQATVSYDNLPVIKGDFNLFVQVFQNLINNALKFHGDQLPTIHISAKRQQHEWVFAVRDNGIGIQEQYLEHIFTMFKRLHDRASYPGNGIGLSICRKVVAHHGGRIWAESELGEGTTFYFTVPATT